MKLKNNEPLKFTADVEILAADVDGEKKGPRKFSVRAYNGGVIRVNRYDLPIVIDLKGMTFAKSIVANLHHDSAQIVGHVTEKTKTDADLALTGVVSGTGPSAQEFMANSDQGFPWQASIEANPVRIVEVAEGKSVNVNGQSFTGPLQVIRQSKLFGIAFLARGADEDTSVTVAAKAASTTKGKDMEPEFVQWLEARGFDDPTTLSDKQVTGMKADWQKEVQAAAAKGAAAVVESDEEEFDADDIKAAASNHSANLEAIYAEHEDDVKADKLAEIRAAATKKTRELKVKALKDRWTMVRFEGELIRAAATVERDVVHAMAPKGPAIHSGSRVDISNAVIEAALCQTLNVPDIDKHFDEKVLEASHKTFRGRVGLQQILIMAASANGYDARPGERISDANLRTVLRYAFPPIEAAFSTVALPGVLGNVANKELLAGYMEEDTSWKEIAASRTVTDFKSATSYRMLDDFAYEEVGAAGEIKHGKLSEESYTRQAKTYAKMFSITRQDIINDDLGAFDDLRNRLGRGAAQKFNDIFWTEFLSDASTFWTSTRTNYITGATTTLLTDGVGLGLGIKAFRQMTSPTADGTKRIMGRPEILLVPPELEYAADQLFMGEKINVGSGPGDTNIYRNKYRPVVSPWLSDSNVTGYSTTAWFLLRNPGIMPAIVVSFLNGVQTPTVESADAAFNVLGIEFRGYHDFGCDQAEYLCGIKSKGAA